MLHDVLEKLQGLLCQELIDRIKEGKASSSDLNVARQVLRDNGFIDTAPRNESPIHQLSEHVPFPAEGDVEAHDEDYLEDDHRTTG